MTTYETKYPITNALTLSEKKRIYELWIETLVRNGYLIRNYLNPIYSKINFDYVTNDLVMMHKHSDDAFAIESLKEYERWYSKIENMLEMTKNRLTDES